MKKSILVFLGLSQLIPAAYLVFAQEVRPPAKKAIVERVPLDKTLGETQFFCGYCHVLTYPEVMKKAHKTWKDDKGHNEIGCVECHYPPDLPAITEHRRIPRTKIEADKKKKKTDWDFMKTELEVFSRLVTVLNMDETTVLRRPKIDDRGCTTSDCHPTDRPRKKEGEYWEKKLKFTEYERLLNGKKEKVEIPFTHKEHYDKKKWVEGQELHCVTCHRKETNAKHFEVSKESCYLCHFKTTDKNVRFAEGRAKCSLCHKIPEKPFKEVEAGEKPVTHKDYEERKVSCASCHLEIIKGKGEIKQEKCLDCHENTKELWKDAENKKVMHKEHVAKQTAACFNCHEPILHKKEIKEYNYVDASLVNCKACHPEPHLYQRLLLAGEGGKGLEKNYPIKHHDMKTNCIACHTKEAYDAKGRRIKAAEEKACIDCHEKEAGETMKGWIKDMAEALKEAKASEKEAIDALEKAKGRVPEKELQKAEILIKRGQENLRLVDGGGGVHNKKFATLLMDTAIADFEEAIAVLKPKK